MSTTRFYVVRHGETVWNAERRIQGFKDSELTEMGLAQAYALADRFEREPIDAVFASDLERAHRTARVIASRCGMKVNLHPGLRERNLGIFQGHTFDEIDALYPNELRLYREGGPDYGMPEGESMRESVIRSVAALEEIAELHPEENILVVTHGGILKGLFCHAVGLQCNVPRHFKIFNAAVNVFSFNSRGWLLETWGDISHLTRAHTFDDV